MTGRAGGRVLAWAGGMVAGAAAAGLAGYFVAVGLDKADKLASAIGVFVGLAGLAVSVYGVALARRATAPGPSAPGGQSVTRSTAGGGVTQVRNVGGDLRLGTQTASSPGSAAPPAPGASPAPTAPSAPEAGVSASGEQSVRDSQVAGDIVQVDGVGGDADIDRWTALPVARFPAEIAPGPKAPGWRARR